MNKTILLVLCLYLSYSAVQANHVTMTMKNPTATANTFEFDVFIANDGTTALNLGGYQIGVNFNTAILNGGTPTTSSFVYIAGTRDAVFANLTNTNALYSNQQMRVSATTVQSNLATPLPIGTEYRLGRFRFTNTVNWTTCSAANLQFQLVAAAGKTNTTAIVYVGSATTQTSLNNAGSTLSGVSNTSALVLNCFALPVELGEFEVVKQGNDHQIRWKTLTESNNHHFVLQHSMDGIQFELLSMIDSKAKQGNSQSVLHYTATHEHPQAGRHFYRLAQVDIQGQINQYDEIVFIDQESIGTEIYMYPNPCSATVNLVLNKMQGKVSWQVFSTLGKQLIRGDQSFSSLESLQIPIDMSHLQQGIYMVNIQWGTQQKTIHLLKEY